MGQGAHARNNKVLDIFGTTAIPHHRNGLERRFWLRLWSVHIGPSYDIGTIYLYLQLFGVLRICISFLDLEMDTTFGDRKYPKQVYIFI